MARLRVLGENPPPPRGNGENQLRELRDYLTRLKDELEYLLTHLGEDNFADDLATWVTDTGKSVESINASIDDINGEIGDINTALAGKQDTLTFDDTPTSGSDNPVKSGGIYSALSGKQNALTFDDSPTSGSSNPVKSGGVYTALAGKQDTLTFDNVPSPGSDNPVKSSGIFDGLKKKAGHNLLRNWLFIGGGTGYGVLPVNQRGQASYATSGIVFTADGWVKNSAVYVYLQSDCIALARSAAGADNFNQFLDSYSALAGMTCTLSLLVKGDSGTRIILGYSDGGDNTYGSWVSLSSTIQLVTFTFSISAAPTQLRIIFRGDWPSTTAKIYLYAAKLELGEEQTLTHLENNAWVLNEVPDYTMELIRCQTCTANADDTYANKTIVVQ